MCGCVKKRENPRRRPVTEAWWRELLRVAEPRGTIQTAFCEKSADVAFHTDCQCRPPCGARQKLSRALPLSLSHMLPARGGAKLCAAKPVCDEASPPRDSERAAPQPWISHLEGRTLVEGIAEAFRHPLPGHPDPIGELLTLGEVDLEHLCRGFMKYNYPEDKYSAEVRERVLEAFRRRVVDGMRDGHAQFRAEVAELQAKLPEEAMQMCGGRLVGRGVRAPCC